MPNHPRGPYWQLPFSKFIQLQPGHLLPRGTNMVRIKSNHETIALLHLSGSRNVDALEIRRLL